MTRTVCGICEMDVCRCKTHPGYVVGSHWLETAYSRVCAGENEAEVLADYGWSRGDEALRRGNERLRFARDALVKVFRRELRGAQWRDKHIFFLDSEESVQNWLLEIYLPVPLSEPDKSPEAALARFIEEELRRENNHG